MAEWDTTNKQVKDVLDPEARNAPAVALAPHLLISESADELGSFDPIIVVTLPDDTRVKAESCLFPAKMFEPIGTHSQVGHHLKTSICCRR